MRTFFAYVAFFFFVVCPNLFSQNVMLQPTLIEISVQPGVRAKLDFTLSSASTDSPVKIDLSPHDLSQSEDGKWLPVEDQDTNERSCRKWITFESNSYILQLGERQVIPIYFNIPSSAKGFYYATIIAESENTKKDTNLSFRFRFIIPVFIEIKNTLARKEIDVTDKVIEYIKGDVNTPSHENLSVTFQNKGKTVSTVSGKVNLFRDINGRWNRITEIELKSRKILPGISMKLTSQLPIRLASGKYRVDVSPNIDNKISKSNSSEIEFEGDTSITNVATDDSFSIDKDILEIEGVSKSTRSAHITVSNNSEDDLQISTDIFLPNSLENVTLNGLLGTDLSLQDYATINPKLCIIRKKSKKNISFLVKYPEANTNIPYYYGIIKVSASYVDGQPAGERKLIVIACNKDAKVNSNLVSSNISISEESTNNYAFVAKYANTGNKHITPLYNAKVVNPVSSNVLKEIKAQNQEMILPMGLSNFSGTIDFSDISAGIYILKVTAIYEKDNTVEINTPIKISNGSNNEKIVELNDLQNEEQASGVELNDSLAAQPNNQPAGVPQDGTNTAQVQ